MLKGVGVSKEFFEYEFDKVHRIGAADGDKQNVIVRFRSHQFPSELYYGRKKSKLMRIIVILSNSVILTSTAILK